jgi:hypothetical protein
MKQRPRVYKTKLSYQRLNKGRRYTRITYYGINQKGGRVQMTFRRMNLDYHYLKLAFLKHIDRYG